MSSSWALLLLLPFPSISAHSSGPPLSACNTMIPSPGLDGHGAPPNSTSPPWRLALFDLRRNPLFEYTPNSLTALQLVVRGPPVRGLLIQARAVAGRGRRVGAFLTPLPPETGLLHCDGPQSASAVGHTGPGLKSGLTFRWRPPLADVGPIHFLATLVVEKTQFWTMVSSDIIYPRSNQIAVETAQCGKGFGCLEVGREGCQDRGDCNFTASWHCRGNEVVLELGGRQSEGERGWAGLGFGRAVPGLPGESVVACEAGLREGARLATYETGPNHRLRSSGPAASLRLLKTAGDGERWLCRFRRRRPRHRFVRRDFGLFLAGKRQKGRWLEAETVLRLNRLHLCRHQRIFLPLKAQSSLMISCFLLLYLCSFLSLLWSV